MPDRVVLCEPCPTCGAEASWHGAAPAAGGGTRYRIVCARCEPVAVVAEPEPAPDPVPGPLAALRLLQARLGWAS